MKAKAVTPGMIKIESGPEIQDILDFRVELTKNAHGRVWIKGMVPEDAGELPVLQTLENGILSVSIPDGEERKQIFCGFIHSLAIEQEGSRYVAAIEGITATELLDRTPKCRSFQDVDMTYGELVRTVLADTPKAEVIFHAEDRRIGRPIYQYRETDWEFLKRIASHLDASLFPGAVSTAPALHFGLSLRRRREEEDALAEGIRFDRSYYAFCRRSDNVRKGHFICRDISCYEKWEAGDYLLLPGGRKSSILAVRGALENGLLVWRYETAPIESFGTPRYENRALAGISLEGTVLKRREELIKIWLDIDREQQTEKAFWYQWIPETGNLMYCMPEEGERVGLVFDEKGGETGAVRAIRRNGAGNGEMQDVSKRYFTTALGKRMYFWPAEMGFEDLQQKITLRMVMEDTAGISIESSRDIHLKAKEGVWMSGNRVAWRAPQEISIFERDMSDPTAINMCNGFDCIGKFGKVVMGGSGNVDFPVLEDESKKYDIKGAERAVTGSTPRMAGRTKLEQKITGTQVDAVMVL